MNKKTVYQGHLVFNMVIFSRGFVHAGATAAISYSSLTYIVNADCMLYTVQLLETLVA